MFSLFLSVVFSSSSFLWFFLRWLLLWVVELFSGVDLFESFVELVDDFFVWKPSRVFATTRSLSLNDSSLMDSVISLLSFSVETMAAINSSFGGGWCWWYSSPDTALIFETASEKGLLLLLLLLVVPILDPPPVAVSCRLLLLLLLGVRNLAPPPVAVSSFSEEDKASIFCRRRNHIYFCWRFYACWGDNVVFCRRCPFLQQVSTIDFLTTATVAAAFQLSSSSPEELLNSLSSLSSLPETR